MLRRLIFAVVLLLAPGAAFAGPVGKPAPKYVLVDYEGHEISQADLRGKVVILNYWATWCAPCRNEMPAMDLYVRHHKGAPLAIYAITVDNQVPYSRLKFLDDSLAFSLVQKLKGRGYGIRGGVPTSYVIDRAGIVRHAKAGAFDQQQLEALVTPLLSEPDPAPPQQAVASR